MYGSLEVKISISSGGFCKKIFSASINGIIERFKVKGDSGAQLYPPAV
jgi:hypothetical protein